MRSFFAKIFLCCLLAVFCVMASATDIVKLRTSEYAFRSVGDNGKWGEWGDWEKTSMPIVLSHNTLVVYSSTQQEYDIYETSAYGDTSDRTIKMSAIDKKGKQCELRLRHKDNYWQLYVDYSDMSWVYNIELAYSHRDDGSNTAAANVANAMSGEPHTATSSTVPEMRQVETASASSASTLNVDDDLDDFKRLIDYPLGLTFLPKNAEGVVGLGGIHKVEALIKQNRSWTCQIKELSTGSKYIALFKHNGYVDSYKGHLFDDADYTVGENYYSNHWEFNFSLDKAKYSEEYVEQLYKDMLGKLEKRLYYQITEQTVSGNRVHRHMAKFADGRKVELTLENYDSSYRVKICITPFDSAHFPAQVSSASSKSYASTNKSSSSSYSSTPEKPSLFSQTNKRKFALGGMGGAIGLGSKTLGAGGFSLTICGFYADIIFKGASHEDDTGVDTWEDEKGIATHLGYQIPIRRWLRLIPLVGYCKVSEGETDGSDYYLDDSGVHNKFVANWSDGGVDFGGMMVLHFGVFNIYLGGTTSSAYGGLGFEF